MYIVKYTYLNNIVSGIPRFIDFDIEKHFLSLQLGNFKPNADVTVVMVNKPAIFSVLLRILFV